MLVYRKGYVNTGIQEILAAANIPKGSFYHHFKSKEDFGLSIIEYWSQFYQAQVDAHLLDDSIPALDRLKRFYDSFRRLMEAQDCKFGCPYGNLAQEMSSINDAFRQKLEERLQAMKSPVVKCLDQARQAGELSIDAMSEDLADFIINSWEGVIITVKVTGNTRSWDVFDRMIFEVLLK